MRANRPDRCADCGGRIEVGDEIRYYPAAAGVEAETCHGECPEVPERPCEAPASAGAVWDDDDCSACGGSYARRWAEGGLPAISGCCGAPWRHDDRDGGKPRLRLLGDEEDAA
jgi:hypothetical protein